MNLLESLTPDLMNNRALAWEHPPLNWGAIPEGGIRVHAPARADYFIDPGGAYVKDEAPYLYKNVGGNFVARALIRPTFATTFDSGVLMLRHDSRHWAKLCFEKTDFGTTAAVSVVTNGVSDDANGVDVHVEQLWLQACRVGDAFSFQYSLDGASWRMVRTFTIPVPRTIKVGIVAQSPIGPGTPIDFLYFSIEPRTVDSLRAGV